jgi:hypothetical protein
MSEAERYGNYSEEQPRGFEYLTLAFSPSIAPLKQRWRNNGLSADFLGDYVTTFFPDDGNDPKSARSLEVNAAVSFIANELLENAMKFHDETSAMTISIHLELDNKWIRVTATNSLTDRQAERYRESIRELMQGDPLALYLAKMESGQHTGEKVSGIGFLTMINDYATELGWLFEPSGEANGSLRVTSQATLRP